MLDDLAHAGGLEGDDRRPGRHGLGDDEALGFRARAEGEHIHRLVGIVEVLPGSATRQGRGATRRRAS